MKTMPKWSNGLPTSHGLLVKLVCPESPTLDPIRYVVPVLLAFWSHELIKASIQWPTAARRPRGLAAICPWEGFGEFYRDAARRGGIAASVQIVANIWFFQTADQSLVVPDVVSGANRCNSVR